MTPECMHAWILAGGVLHLGGRNGHQPCIGLIGGDWEVQGHAGQAQACMTMSF